MIRKNFKIRPCCSCGELLGASSYSNSKSIFFTDGKLPICNDCLDKEAKDWKGSWDFANQVCQWADVPFIPEQWTKIYKSTPDKAISTYLKFLSKDQYQRVHWEEYEEKWREAIKNNNERDLHPVFNQKEIDQLALDWGPYTTQELYSLEKYFQELKTTFGISDAATEKDARFLAKISLEMDKNIANGAQGIEKLVSAYNKIKESGGFSADKASGADDFSSVSELVCFMEKNGWVKKFHNDETNDIVDNTIKNMQSYISRLYSSEASISDQIESKLQTKRRLDYLEEETFEDFDQEAYTIREEEIEEEFDPEI